MSHIPYKSTSIYAIARIAHKPPCKYSHIHTHLHHISRKSPPPTTLIHVGHRTEQIISQTRTARSPSSYVLHHVCEQQQQQQQPPHTSLASQHSAMCRPSCDADN